jgi:hypothetical protein
MTRPGRAPFAFAFDLCRPPKLVSSLDEGEANA